MLLRLKPRTPRKAIVLPEACERAQCGIIWPFADLPSTWGSTREPSQHDRARCYLPLLTVPEGTALST